MARKLRIQYPGAIYHVMNRGDRRDPIFKDDQDYTAFLATLGEACAKAHWQVHAYCLMRNHFHRVLETPNANLVAGMAGHRNPVKWIAARVRLGTSKSANKNLHQWLQAHPEPAAHSQRAKAAKKHETTK